MEQLFDLNGNALSLGEMKNRKKKFDIDLKGATLIEVLKAYSDHKKKHNVNYRAISPVVENLELIEKEQLEDGDHLMPDDVTDVFYNIFIGFLIEKGLQTSSIKNYCGLIVCSLKWGCKHNVVLSPTYDEYTVIPENKTRVSLTASEVTRIGYFDIKRTLKGKRRADYIATLERVRDMFVLACNLGQRYSDMVAITPECFNRNIFKIKQQKTGNVATVNIDEFAIDPALTYEILKRYNNRAPTTVCSSHYNRYLPELFALIGGSLDEEISVDMKVQGVMKRKTMKKRDLLRSHSARRTFISINVLRGKPEYKIRKASGHKDARSFQRYICLGED